MNVKLLLWAGRVTRTRSSTWSLRVLLVKVCDQIPDEQAYKSIQIHGDPALPVCGRLVNWRSCAVCELLSNRVWQGTRYHLCQGQADLYAYTDP